MREIIKIRRIKNFWLNNFWFYMLTLSMFLIMMIEIYWYIIGYRNNTERLLTIIVATFIWILLSFPRLIKGHKLFLDKNFKKIVINKKGITLKVLFKTQQHSQMNEVQNVYIVNFPGVSDCNTIKVVNDKISHENYALINFYGLAGPGVEKILIKWSQDYPIEYKKYPEKWILIDNGKLNPLDYNELGDKLLDFLVPMNRYSVFKIKYSEKNLNKIKKYWNKEIKELEYSTKLKFWFTTEKYALRHYYFNRFPDTNFRKIWWRKDIKVEKEKWLNQLPKFIKEEHHEKWIDAFTKMYFTKKEKS